MPRGPYGKAGPSCGHAAWAFSRAAALGAAVIGAAVLALPSATHAQSASSFWRTSLADADTDPNAYESDADMAAGGAGSTGASAGATVEPMDPDADPVAGTPALPPSRPAGEPPRGIDAATAQTAAGRQLPAGATATARDDRFAPLGLRLGTLRVLPRATLYATTDLDGDVAPVLSGEVDVESDWARHSLNVSARADVDLENPDTYSAEGLAAFEAELGASQLGTDTRFRLTAGGRLGESDPLVDTALPSDTDLVSPNGGSTGVGAVATPESGRLVLGYATLTHELGRLELEAGAAAEWAESYDSAALRARVGYEFGSTTPFIEATVSRTQTNAAPDSEALGLLAGLDFGQDGRLRGSVAAGAEWRRTDAVAPLTGSDIDSGALWLGAVSYDVTPLLTLDASAETSMAANAARVDTLTLGVTHALRRWLTLQAGVDASWTRPADGPDTQDIAASVGASYAIGRHARLTADYTHQRSDDGLAETENNTLRFGLTVQR